MHRFPLRSIIRFGWIESRRSAGGCVDEGEERLWSGVDMAKRFDEEEEEEGECEARGLLGKWRNLCPAEG